MIKRILDIFYKTRTYYGDDFDWSNYTKRSYYRRLINNVQDQYHTTPQPGEVIFDDEQKKVINRGFPLHPNQLLLLEAIGILSPESVHEAGCGAGDHLASISIVYPHVQCAGGDRARSQLDLALSRHPNLSGSLGLQDITMPYSRRWPRSELVYTQAVVMHIHTAVSHFMALSNLARMTKNYLLLIENFQSHNFVSDINNLFDNGHFANWDELHMHRLDASSGSKALIVSKTPLDLPKIHNDRQLREHSCRSVRRLKKANIDSDNGTFGYPY
jgi:hypothetical protein